MFDLGKFCKLSSGWGCKHSASMGHFLIAWCDPGSVACACSVCPTHTTLLAALLGMVFQTFFAQIPDSERMWGHNLIPIQLIFLWQVRPIMGSTLQKTAQN